MNPLKLLLSAFALVLVFASDLAVWSKEPDKLSQVIAATGMDVSFDNFEKSLAVGLEQLPSSRPDRAEFIAASKEAAAIAFAATPMKAILKEEMSDKLAEADLDAILQFYKQPLAKHITELENAASTPEAIRQTTGTSTEILKKLEADPKRADLYRAIDKSLNLSVGSIESALNLQRAILVGMSAADGQELPPEVFERILAGAKAKLTEQIPGLTFKHMALTYRDAKTEDLEAYLQFWSSSAGQNLWSTGRTAKNRVLVAASLIYGQDLLKRMRTIKRL